MNNSPPIGIAVLVFKNGRILFGRCGERLACTTGAFDRKRQDF